MAPKVCVPADFGRHHIGAPSHGNLTFNLQEGLQIKANSIILSLNSPVIDDLTTNLHLTSLEAEDFSREAVDCFIEASYTGEVEALNQGNFRDVNKMSVVFKVDWLVARCEEYFVSYLSKLNSESTYPDILFAVEEAVYLLSALKRRDFLNLVVKKMKFSISIVRRDSFINQYLSDLSGSTFHQIDTCIAIVDNDVHVMVELLIGYLGTVNRMCLDEKSRYLFKKLDLNLCLKMRPDIHEKLLSLLENLDNVENDDYKLLLRKMREQSTVQHEEMQLRKSSSVAMYSFAPYLSPSHLEDFIDMLVASGKVDNLYKLIDGVWSRLLHCKDDIVSDSVIEMLVKIKVQKGWKNVDQEYVNRLFTHLHPNFSHGAKFLNLLRNCNELVSKRSEVLHSFAREFKSSEEFMENILKKNNEIFFRFDDSKFDDLSFILSTTAMKGSDPDSFNMSWSVLSRKPQYDAPKLHIALEIWIDSTWQLFPITWCGKPTCEPTKTAWNWGYIWFGDFGNKDVTFQNLIKGKNSLVNSYLYVDCSSSSFKTRFVSYII